MADLSPDDMLLTPENLRERVLDRSPTAYGITVGTMRSVLSNLRFVLRRLDVIDPADAPLTPAWEAQLNLLSQLRRAGLIGVARFCSVRDVAPIAMSPETPDAFEAYLTTRTLASRPAKTVSEMRRAWNHACAHVEGWAGQPLPPRKQLDHYVLPLLAFPISFQTELADFGQQLGATELDGPDALDTDDEKPLTQKATLRASTIAMRLDHIRWAASAEVASGVPLSEITSLASLFDPPARAKAALRYLRDRTGGRPSAAGTHVAEVFRIIAKHHLGLSPAQLARIRSWGKPVALTYKGMTERNERCMKDAMQPDRLERLLQLPEAFMQAARRLRASAPDQARALVLRALAIEILTKLPIRLANLTGLRPDRHFHRPNLRGGLVSHLLIPPEEMKNTRAISLPVPRATAQLIEEWTAHYRLASVPGCAYLFPGCGTGDRPITHQGMRDAIKDATRTHVGVELSPHQFRHLAARLFLDAYPGHYEEVRQLLGHASVTTTTRHYSGIESESAARRFDEDVLGRHVGSRPQRGDPGPGRRKFPRSGRR
ncbi:tyrosine-type recombinase/integrase [Dankookia sp. GCM10030260]|uniref:tyrosine-type recombinase/integrase n=1 Tax=Dankookia sp. GCM10030260 TaxID=3273390 RepID=UPI003608EC90